MANRLAPSVGGLFGLLCLLLGLHSLLGRGGLFFMFLKPLWGRGSSGISGFIGGHHVDLVRDYGLESVIGTVEREDRVV